MNLSCPAALAAASRSTLAVALAAALGAGALSAQAQSVATAQDPIVVTATRQPTRVSAQLADVTVIDRDTIEQSAGRTLAEVLAQQPGLQMISNGGMGKSSSVVIRGGDTSQTLLLVDGVRYGSATLGEPVFENIPLESIERIEIVRGPMSSLYGADAAGGVIQVFTRQGRDGLHPSAHVGAGSNGYWSAGGGVDGGSGAWSGAAHVQAMSTDGFSATNEHVPFGSYDPDDDGFRQTSADASVRYRFNDAWQAGARALHSQGRTHIDDGPGADAKADLTSDVLAADLTGRVTRTWRTTVRVARTADDYETLSSASPYTDLGSIKTVQREYSWENGVDTPIGSVLALAERIEQKVRKPAQPFDEDSRHIDAVALGLSGQAGRHTWQASVRHDHNSQFGSENTGNVAYGFDLTPQWRASASYGTSFVAPSFNQLYYPGYGNPALTPQRGRNKEVALRWRPADGQQLTLTGYDNRVRDYIDPQNDQVPHARFKGGTLAYEGGWRNWDFAASYDHVKAQQELDGVKTELNRRAKNSAKASADTAWGDWRVGAGVAAYSSRRDTGYDADFNSVGVKLPGYAVVDLHAEWRFARDWALQARLNNVGDRDYETAYGYNQPGREVYATLRWSPR